MTQFVDPATLPDLATWRATVERDLKGASFDARLITTLHEGIDVQPLYAGAVIDPGPVGAPDYRRASGEWEVRQRYEDAAIETAREAIARDLERGVEGVQLLLDRAARLGSTQEDDLGADGISVASGYELARLLGEVDLASTTLHLDAGAQGAIALGLLLAVAARSRVDRRQLTAFLAHDPLSALLRDGQLPCSLDDAWDDAASLVEWCAEHAPAIRPLQISTAVVHESGGDAVQEIAFALASGVELLRAMESRGLAPAAVVAALAAETGVSTDLFLETAKLRAMRQTWSRMLEACGVGPASRELHVHAVTSVRSLARVDAWTNMLRVSTQSFAAIAGGATSVASRPFDTVLGSPSRLGRRVARNSQLILRDESGLGRVADPAGGSWYVESLTNELAERAWQQFQDIERRGGLQACVLDGSFAQLVGETRRRRETDSRFRRAPMTGVSAYALPGETPPETAPRRPDGFAARRTAELQAEGRGPGVAAALEAVSSAASRRARLDAVVDAAAAGATVPAITRTLARAPAAAKALPPYREAAAYEAVRMRLEQSGHAESLSVLALGALAQVNARASWALSALGAAGLHAPAWQPHDSVDAAADAGGHAAVTLICMPDDRFSDDLEASLRVARSAGARVVIVAGHPKKAPPTASPDHWLHIGCDLLDVLEALTTTLEGEA